MAELEPSRGGYLPPNEAERDYHHSRFECDRRDLPVEEFRQAKVARLRALSRRSLPPCDEGDVPRRMKASRVTECVSVGVGQ
jgi:hypothetical protein